MDSNAAHKRVEIRDRLAANPRVHVHFTPTSGSWLNLVEVWFGIIERQAIRRGRLHFNDDPLPAPFASVISRGGRSLSTTCVCQLASLGKQRLPDLPMSGRRTAVARQSPDAAWVSGIWTSERAKVAQRK